MELVVFNWSLAGSLQDGQNAPAGRLNSHLKYDNFRI
jgi:hypothetical protein